tara:strand:- start:1348 stop:1509 length:162 start_codon:yes stop_codon:yes gene_type:complete
MKKITQELLSRKFIKNNIKLQSKESIFEYVFNNAVQVANNKKGRKNYVNRKSR